MYCTHLVGLNVIFGYGFQLSGGNGSQETGWTIEIRTVLLLGYQFVTDAGKSTCLSKIGRSNASFAYAMNFFKSVLLIPPIGLTSASKSKKEVIQILSVPIMICLTNVPDEQSYFVKYPRRLAGHVGYMCAGSLRYAYLSSTFALPRTSRAPERPRTHGISCANIYERTMRSRAFATYKEF